MLSQEELEQVIRMYLQQGGYASMGMSSMSGEDMGLRAPGYELMMPPELHPQQHYQRRSSTYAPDHYAAHSGKGQYGGSSYQEASAAKSYKGGYATGANPPSSYAKGSGGATYATRGNH